MRPFVGWIPTLPYDPGGRSASVRRPAQVDGPPTAPPSPAGRLELLHAAAVEGPADVPVAGRIDGAPVSASIQGHRAAAFTAPGDCVLLATANDNLLTTEHDEAVSVR